MIPRPKRVTLSTGILTVLGCLFAVGAALALLASVGDPYNGMLGYVGWLFVAVGVLFTVLGVAHLAAGIGALRRKNLARLLGIGLSVALAGLFVLAALSDLLGHLRIEGIVLWIALAGPWAIAAWGLFTSSDWFVIK